MFTRESIIKKNRTGNTRYEDKYKFLFGPSTNYRISVKRNARNASREYVSSRFNSFIIRLGQTTISSPLSSSA